MVRDDILYSAYKFSFTSALLTFLDIPRPAETREQFEKPLALLLLVLDGPRLTIADLNDATLGPTLLRDLGRRCATSLPAVRTRW
jgi:hypothetical protein